MESPYQTGQLIGGLFTLLLAGAAVAKCVQVLRRPTSEPRCITALLLVAVAWLLGGLKAFVEQAFGLDAPWLDIAFAIVFALLFLGAFVLAIVGLASYDRGRHRQGRAQAIWALVLSVIMGLAMLAAAGLALRELSRATKGTAAPRELVRAEFNFALTSARPWVELDPAALSPDACLALRRTHPEMACVVIAELAGNLVDQAHLATIARANLESAAELIESAREEVTVGAFSFTHLRSRARAQGLTAELAYEHWILVQRGFAFQIIGWAESGEAAQLARELRTIVETFRLLDPAREAAGPGAIEAHARPELGYALELTGQGWSSWPDLQDDLPLADYGVQRPNEGLAVWALPVEPAPPALEELAAGLLAQLGFEYPDGGRFRTRDWSPYAGGEGLEIETERTIDGDSVRYLLRVARGPGIAHLVAGWAGEEQGDLELVARALDGVTLAAPATVPPEPDDGQRVERGNVWNQAGLAYFAAGDYAAARPWFERGFAEADDPVMLDNLAWTLELLGEVDEALERVTSARQRFPRAHELGLRQARLLLLAGRAEEAEAAAVALAQAGFRDESAFAELLDLFGSEGEFEHGVRAAEAWPAREGAVEVPRSRAYLHYLADEPERAQAILVPLHAEHPELLEITYDLAHVKSELGDHAGVGELLEPLLANDPGDTTALTILAWSQLERGWLREAKATFERAAALAPEDDEIADGLRQASAALGQGDNSDLKTPLAPVEPPAELVRALEELPALDLPEEPAVVLLRSSGYHFVPGQKLRRTQTFRVRAQNAAGAEQWSTIRFGFDPLSERVFLDRAEVRDPRGELIARASLDDAYVTSVDEDGLADHESQLTLPVPGMKPGCTLEWRVTVEERAPADEFRFQRHVMALGIPGERDAVFVTGATDSVRAVLTRGERVRALAGDGFLAWVLPAPTSLVAEPQQARVEQHLPMLYLGGGTAGWTERAREYLDELAGLLEPDAAARALARELTAGLVDERAKLAVLARHVQRELRYEAIEFGVRGQRPNAAAETLRLRYGDCKDHALLLVQLLTAAGIESHLALVDTGWSLRPDLPSLDQFDHMVVHVPVLGEERLVDTTDKFLDPVDYPPNGLWEAQALVLDPAAPRLLAPPVRRGQDFRIESQRVLTVRERELEVEETLTLYGTFSSWMRFLFSSRGPAEQRQLAQELLADAGNARLKEFAFENRAALEQPAVLVLRYVLPAGVRADGARRSLELPAVFERMFLGPDFLAERRTPFETLEPTHFTSTTHVRLPAAPEADALRALTRSERNDFCTWSLAAEPGAEPVELALRFEFEAVTGLHPAARWADYHAAVEAALEACSASLAWRQE